MCVKKNDVNPAQHVLNFHPRCLQIARQNKQKILYNVVSPLVSFHVGAVRGWSKSRDDTKTQRPTNSGGRPREYERQCQFQYQYVCECEYQYGYQTCGWRVENAAGLSRPTKLEQPVRATNLWTCLFV